MRLTQEKLEEHGHLFLQTSSGRAVVVRLEGRRDGSTGIGADIYVLDCGAWVALGPRVYNPDITTVAELLEKVPELDRDGYSPAAVHVELYCAECGDLLMDTPVSVGKRMFCRKCGVRFNDACSKCGTQKTAWLGDHVGGTIDCTIGKVRCDKCGHEWYAYRDLRPFNKKVLLFGYA